MMKAIFALSLALASLAVASLNAATLAKYIDSDAQVVISVKSPADTYAQWQEHPFRKIYEDEALQDLIKEISESHVPGEGLSDEFEYGFLEVMKEEFGLTVEEFFELFAGEMALAFYNLTDDLIKTGTPNDGVMMAEYSGDSARLHELLQVQFERNADAQKKMNPEMEHIMITEDFMGETLYFDEAFNGEETYIEDGYALVDGVFILATEERLRNTVELMKEGDDSLFDSGRYQQSLEQSGRGDLRAYINLEALIAPLNELLKAEVGKGGLAMFGVTAESVDAALSLESLQAAFIDIDLAQDGLVMHSGVLYSEKEGLLRMLTYSGNALPEAPYVPQGIFSSSISNFDISAMLAELESLIGLASPSVPMLLDIQLQNMKAETGIDLRTALLENFSGDVVSLSVLGESTLDLERALTEQLYVLEVKDAEALSQAIEAFKDQIPGMRELVETQKYEGHTIYLFKGQSNLMQPDVGVQDFSYVITRSELILNLGRVELLKEVLTRMAEEKNGFWQLESTDTLFGRIARPNPVTRSIADLERMVNPILDSFTTAASMGGIGSQFDVSKIPNDLDIPVVLISESNEEDDGFFMRAYLLEREIVE